MELSSDGTPLYFGTISIAIAIFARSLLIEIAHTNFLALLLQIDLRVLSVPATGALIICSQINQNWYHQLYLKVIAEGVETQAELDFLIENRCDEIQGYLLGVPLPPTEFEREIPQYFC
jgi:EAL domain